MIPDSELLTEIQTDPAGLGYAGAGASVIHALINAEGSASVDDWVLSPQPRPMDKGHFLEILTDDEKAKLLDLMNSGTVEGKALKFDLEQCSVIDMTRARWRQKVEALTTAEVLSTEARDAILRLGEIRKSRAQELWGEAVQLEQIKQVLGVA